MKNFRIALPLAALLASACAGDFSLTTSEPAPVYYLLHPAEEPAVTAPEIVVVMPETPKTAPGLNTSRIALYRNDKRVLDYYAEGRWPETLDITLGAFLTESLEQAFSVRPEPYAGPSDTVRYRVIPEIRDFQAEYQGAPEGIPEVKATLRITVVKAPEDITVAAFTVSHTEKAAGNGLTAITGALQKALREAMAEAVRKIAEAARP